MILLIAVFTGGTGLVTQSGLPSFALEPLQALLDGSQLPRLLFVLIILLGISLLIRLGLIFVEGLIGATLRRKIQETIFKRFLHGDWAHMRSFRVGDAVGTNTQEAMVVSKYMVSAVTALYYLLSAAVMGGLALLASFKVALVLGCIALPLAVLVQKIFSVQARLSRRSAELRNEFSSDITDRFNGLLQVQVDNNFKYHEERGLHTQPKLTSLDIKIGACQAVIGSFSLLLIFTALLGFSLWIQFFGATDIPDLGLIASVGVLGLKAAGQLNGLVGAVGNLSRLSGSLYPVIDALKVPARLPRQAIDEQVAGIEASSINYSYDTLLVIDMVSLKVKRREPLVLSGRSGKGKTTLANLLAGLYVPEAGEIVYIGESGRRYSGNQYYAKVGFVTQDIYLFQGTLRENLTAGRNCAEAEVWEILEQVDAADFVRQLGGLDTESVEAGRALSGGQRRRLGVARVLLSGADVLIFDEVTAGLDQANKTAVISVIERLSEQYVIVLISHDPLTLSGQTSFIV
jgi:ABC-type multidrug transport system fused ATPase/permease subunit